MPITRGAPVARRDPKPVFPEPGDGVEIVNLAQFWLDAGIVFEVNRTIFHQTGFALRVRDNEDTGQKELAFFDHRKNPTLTFDPTTFQQGQSKWREFWRTVCVPVNHLRKRRLGFTVQTKPNYRDQQLSA